MKQLATIAPGHADFDPRLRGLLEASQIDPHEFEDLDWFGLLPFFVLAGASVRTDAHAHGDHTHFASVVVELPEDLEEGFFGSLPVMLDQAYGEDEEE
jgi:hypothetical protein